MSGLTRIAYLDCSTGVSGDKFLGALLDAGEPNGEFTAEHLRAIVSALAPEARVSVERVLSHGVSALSVRVTAEGDAAHRQWSDIRALIADADAAVLAEPARGAALHAFEALAIAEAAIHGADVERVHFHEVGAIDSIVDVVGVCAGLHALGIARLTASPIAVGSGTVETSHGVLPVPAPATAALLAGIPILSGPAPGELTTPTGAALVRALADDFGVIPPMTIEWLGYGAGTRDIGAPNICRIMIGETAAGRLGVPGASPEPVVLLETNIDHLPAEELAFAAEELLAGGALDVWQTPIVMKKGRSAIMLSVLASTESADALTQRAIELTGSLGVRRMAIERSCVPRDAREVATPWGPARVKVGAGRLRPEHDDIARIARAEGLPYAAVAREIARLAAEPDAVDER
ncbi:MAG TPA: nickel pincer cofactor biosynthesis protein LarC [Coriobacteriia bacterium]